MDEPTPAELALLAAIAGPSRVTIDGNTTEQRPISELIAADQYLRARRARRGSGIRWSLFIPPGAQ